VRKRHAFAAHDRVDLKTGRVRIAKREQLAAHGPNLKIAGGAATALDLPLDKSKELKSLTVRALAKGKIRAGAKQSRLVF